MSGSPPWFGEEHDLFRRHIREFVLKELAPHVDEWERAGVVPREVFRRLGAQGYLGIRFRPEYGGAFERYDISGWDECFPSIGQCYYPEPPWHGVVVPDHGELWTLPWHAEPLPDGLRLWTKGVRFPYTFEKRLASGETRM